MTAKTAPCWSEESGERRIGRRELFVLSAAAAATLLTAGSAPSLAAPARDLVGAVGSARWGWTVELAVLQRLGKDRRAALELLWAALERDLTRPMRKPSLRLYDLYAAATDSAGRAALARLVLARSSDPALLSRTLLWSDPVRQRRNSLWRTTGPDRQPIGIDLAQS
jgi:hypothetical protein